MSDNRTTEPTAINRIISTLRERDVQFATHGNTDRVWWTTENGVTWYAQDRPNANDLFVKLEAVLTPEQAIAATLGNSRVDYHGYEQAAIEAWESIKAWNSRAERTCECIACAYFENKSTCGAYCNYFDRELGDDYDGGCTWGVLSGCKVVGE